MDSDLPLQGRIALVTGASSGIGRATALTLARRGADVVLSARRGQRLREVENEIQEETAVATLVREVDVTEEAQVEQLIESIEDAFGGLDIVVNNAGVVREAAVESMSTAKYREMMGVNVDGVFFTTRAAIPYLRERSGNVVFVGSFSGQYPAPFNPVYAGSKWWLRGFAFSLAGAIGPDDVAVTVINPTGVRTELGAQDRAVSNAERFNPGEAAEPIDVAKGIAFAVEQDSPNTVNELDFYVRDVFESF